MATVCAVLFFPIWDDAYLLLLVGRGGGAVNEGLIDRPVLGVAWSFFASGGHLIAWSAAVHFISWAGMGVVTYRLALRAGAGAATAALAAALSVSPVVAVTQVVLVNPVLGALTGVVLAYAAAELCTEPAASVKWVVGVLLGAASTLLSEYGLAASFGALVAGWALSTKERWAPRRAGGVLGACLGYGVFWLFASHIARPSTQPDVLMGGLPFRLKHMLPRLIDSITYSATSLVRNVMTTRVDTTPGIVLVVAAVAAGFLWWWSTRVDRQDPTAGMERTPWLLLAVAAGVIPAHLGGRSIDSGAATRFLLPALPSIASLIAIGVTRLVRREFARPAGAVIAGLIVFAWGTYIVQLWGLRRLPPFDATALAGGEQSLVRVDFPTSPLGPVHDYEITGRLTVGWSASARDRTWMLPTESPLPGPTPCSPRYDRTISGVERHFDHATWFRASIAPDATRWVVAAETCPRPGQTTQVLGEVPNAAD